MLFNGYSIQSCKMKKVLETLSFYLTLLNYYLKKMVIKMVNFMCSLQLKIYKLMKLLCVISTIFHYGSD